MTVRMTAANDKNGTNSAQAFSHTFTIAGYLASQVPANSARRSKAAASVGAVYTGLRSLANAGQSFRDAYLNDARRRWTTHNWTIAFGQIAMTASGRPVRPSQTTMHTSATPRFLISVRTCNQYLAPSPPSPAHNPKMSRSPSTVTPMATYMGRL